MYLGFGIIVIFLVASCAKVRACNLHPPLMNGCALTQAYENIYRTHMLLSVNYIFKNNDNKRPQIAICT